MNVKFDIKQCKFSTNTFQWLSSIGGNRRICMCIHIPAIAYEEKSEVKLEKINETTDSTFADR